MLDATERDELRDTDVETKKVGLSGQMAGGLDDGERMLAAEIIAPLVVANSSFSPDLTQQARDRAAEAIPNVIVNYDQDETIVRRGEKITATDIEAIDQFGLRDARPDVLRLGGWYLLATLVVTVLLGWIWRFRRTLWNRTNAMLLIGLIVFGTALLLKLTGGRPGLAYIVPTAAAGMLLTILLDAGTATIVMGLIALIGGAVNPANQLEITTYIFLGGMAGVIAIRRGDRLQVFVQAGLLIAIVNVLVVAMFGFLGSHDARGVIELMGASVVAAAGSAVATVGLFAVLGSLFGILTVFQLLELANPSQPLLRRLLVETPGTYHHSLMVGNLAERAAEAIGADPLLTRVAAYYHDIGKLANPLAFIENQTGGENIHDELDPETSAQILKAHVPDGIDIAYKAKLPKALIAFIPQHHGTAHLSYFYARAKGLAAEPYGGPQTADGAKAAAAVDERKYRHSGPKPQTREVGADHAGRRRRGVRPVAGVARRAGHPGDGRADHRRADRRRAVRRVRPDDARRREDQGSVRPAAARDVPPADRVPAEQGRRARDAARHRYRHGGVTPVRLGPWRIDPDVRDGVRRPLPIAVAALARSMAAALTAAGAPSPASIGLILSDDAELATLNETHLGHDGPTDVLSFPLLPPEAFPPHPGDPDRGAAPPPARPRRSPARPAGGCISATSWCRSSAPPSRPPRAAAARPVTSAGPSPTSSASS